VANRQDVQMVVNGRTYRALVPPRLLLSDFLRDELHLTGTHVGCENGACGACTVLLNGRPVCSCLMFAVQAEGQQITTIEGIGSGRADHPVQQGLRDHHAIQCGFCTSGLVTSAVAFLGDHPEPSDEEIRAMLTGHLCRCTGYQNIVRAIKGAALIMKAEES
jgi:aerobic carbon-monoxide dehydrogenase small subunit